tara:strand:+ start:8549 stop:9286 length:738 start_codon:yes stop_codon:yes gene_type:complete
MQDTQRQKVYDWEDSQSFMIKKSYLTQKQCHAVIKRLNKIFNKQVKLKFKNGYGNSFARGQKEIFIRNEWARSYSVLLHEYAHCLTNDKHGKSFVSEFCVLLHYLHPLQPSISELAKSLNKANVDFISFDKTIASKKLSKRFKPFKDVSTIVIPKAIKYVYPKESYKQKCQRLKNLHEWLYLERDYERCDFTIDVFDDRKATSIIDYFDDGDYWECKDGVYEWGSWKEAYLAALHLINTGTLKTI